MNRANLLAAVAIALLIWNTHSSHASSRVIYAAEECCTAVLGEGATEEAKRAACKRAVRLNLPLWPAVLPSHTALDVVFCVNKLLGGDRKITDYYCCRHVYKDDAHCLNRCHGSYFTAAYSSDEFRFDVRTCKADNPTYTCFDECLHHSHFTQYDATECALSAMPELIDGIPLEVAD